MKEVDETMDGYCNIERKMTIHKKLPNGKYICISSNCSHAGGQHSELPKPPRRIKVDEYKRLKLKDLNLWDGK